MNLPGQIDPESLGISDEQKAAAVNPVADSDDKVVDGALRPSSLAEFTGQPRVADQLGLMLAAAKHRNAAPDHVLLSGPPGLGKTTLR